MLVKFIRKLLCPKSGQDSYHGSLDMRKPIGKSTSHASPTSFAKTIAQLKTANIMASEEPRLDDKIRMALSMKAAQHLGQKAGMEIYNEIRVDTAIDHAAFAKVIRIHYGKASLNWSFPKDSGMHSGSGEYFVEQIVHEMLPTVCIAYAAKIPLNTKIEVKL